jgi:uncharacterized membrane protein YphA (DoxX/SURF4 family)
MSYIHERSPTWRDLPIDLISRSPIARWAPVPLRLIVGYGFMEHGFAKLARGLDAFPTILQALGVPAPHLMGWLTILVEIFGGLAVLLGALVPLASIPMAAVLLVAIFTVHLPYGFRSLKVGTCMGRLMSSHNLLSSLLIPIERLRGKVAHCRKVLLLQQFRGEPRDEPEHSFARQTCMRSIRQNREP